jgi:hypothetical protein
MPKHALIIGVDYIDRYPLPPLRGCIRDGVMMETMLSTQLHYDSVVFLRDDVVGHLPTKANIMANLRRLSELSSSLDEICIYYGGHGSLIPDFDGDERIGADSIIFPCDTFDPVDPAPGTPPLPSGQYYIVGPIVDDELQSILQQFRCPTLIIMDCCNNGTGADLQWSFDEIRAPHYLSPRIQNNRKTIDNPHIFMISGSRDEQLSIELPFYDNYTHFGGLLTFVLLNCLRDAKYSIDIAKLYCQIYFAVKTFNATLSQVFTAPNGGFQIPVLSSSNPSPAYMWTGETVRPKTLTRTPHQVVQSSMSCVKWSSVHQRFYPKIL